MSKIFETMFGTGEKDERACKVAYTLNSAQPVQCTIIDDEPLFYMDYEANLESEDDHFNLSDIDALESELRVLAQSMERFDRVSGETQQDASEKIMLFHGNVSDITAKDIRVGAGLDIDGLRAILGQSRLGAAYLECADKHNVEISFNTHIETASYERAAGKILINPNLDAIDQILLAVRELRRHWQHRAGALINPMLFDPDNAVLVNRAQNADLVTSMIRVGWELQLSGQKEVWERLEGSTMADLARAFAREALQDFRTLNSGMAATAAFESWFLSERCRHVDRTLIQHMLADYQGYVFDQEEATKSITPTLISALGEMPFGKNYLANHAVTIMEDPIFTDIRDRSNANFLWFIKFERSFRETEQELQTPGVSSAEGVRQGTDSKNRDSNHDHAQIIELYQGVDDKKAQSGKKSEKLLTTKTPKGDTTDGTNVVYLRRWSGD